MNIQLKKFGTMLISRPEGREAYLAFLPTLREIKEEEQVMVDFEGVITLAPSWAHEFFSPLKEKYGQKLVWRNTGNSSVISTLQFLNFKV